MGPHNLKGWAFAVAGAALLNLFLFGLMPQLTRVVPARPEKLDEIKPIQVIRIKKTPVPPPKIEPRKDPPRPLKNQVKSHKTPAPQKSVNLKPRLAFELNLKLPAAPTDLIMPDLAQFSMDSPPLKDHYTLAEIDSPLIPLVNLPPIYPPRARRRGIEGVVVVEFLVTRQGQVKDVTIIEAEPRTVFEQSVIQCVSQWRFKPGTVQGILVATQARTTIRFQLEQP